MSDIAIKVENLSKQYRIGGPQARYKTLRDSLSDAAAAPIRRISSVLRGESTNHQHETIWALKDVSFEVKKGEVVGIIGRNGAGKSTLLKVLSRITEPTEGSVDLFGRVGSLLEVGTGFHPELTGRENIYLNGAILGMKKVEIERKFDEMVDFSGVEKFIDTPVKHYSSGMYVRLAFAVAAHLDPEILLVDEVLAVGDAAFQKKCLGKMGEVANEGRTVLFVSHNMGAIQNLCSRAFFFDNGLFLSEGNVDAIINTYLDNVLDKVSPELTNRSDRKGNGCFQFTEIKFNGYENEEHVIKCGKKVKILLAYEAKTSIKNVSVSIGFFDSTGSRALYLGNEVAGFPLERLPEIGHLVCTLEKFPLLPGRYSINVHCLVNGVLADWIREAVVIDVNEGNFYRSGRLPPKGYGFVAVDHEWEVDHAF